LLARQHARQRSARHRARDPLRRIVLARSFRSQQSIEHAQRGEPARDRRLAQASLAFAREEGSHVARLHVAERSRSREETDESARAARVAPHRKRGEPRLDAGPLQEALDRRFRALAHAAKLSALPCGDRRIGGGAFLLTVNRSPLESPPRKIAATALT